MTWEEYIFALQRGRVPASIPQSVPLGRLAELRLAERPDADRIATASGTAFGDVRLRRFNSRAVLARCVRMQQRRQRQPGDWRPIVALTDGEGY